LKGANKPGVERELKFARVDLEQIRGRLLELEAERLGAPAEEENWLLDRAGELSSKGAILRVRRDGRGAWLTWKGPALFEDRVKLRSEIEIAVSTAEGVLKLLEQLGFVVVRRYQKVREEWRLGAETICLDHTPIGDFVEFEGEKAEALAKRCGFDPKQAVTKSYLALYDEYLASHPGAPHDMLFPEDGADGGGGRVG
jgi:predicted adenylyl cyclase CyaB